MVATKAFRAPEYAYDALGRRVQFIDSVNTVTKRFYLDGQRVIEEYDAAGTPARQRYYVWGNYIDELLMFNDDAGDDSDYNVCHDQLYSPHGLLSKADGAIVERYDYDAYGKPVIYTATGAGGWWDGDEVTATVSAKGLPYLFTGREFEPLDGAALKLQYSRARYYSFPLRRWLQRDPIGYVDGMSLYEYVNSNPILLMDALGLQSVKECIAEIDKSLKEYFDWLSRIYDKDNTALLNAFLSQMDKAMENNRALRKALAKALREVDDLLLPPKDLSSSLTFAVPGGVIIHVVIISILNTDRRTIRHKIIRAFDIAGERIGYWYEDKWHKWKNKKKELRDRHDRHWQAVQKVAKKDKDKCKEECKSVQPNNRRPYFTDEELERMGH